MNILINNLERDITCLQATSEATKQKIRLIKEHVSTQNNFSSILSLLSGSVICQTHDSYAFEV